MCRNAGGITGMESAWPEILRQAGLAIVADMINHRGQVGLQFGKKPADFVEPSFKGIKAGPHGYAVRCGGTAGLLRAASQYPVKMFWLPAQSYGQGVECAAATTALHGMPLDLPHHGHRHMRTLRKLPLSPAKFADTIADNPRDRIPVLRIAFRHAFLRAPLPALTVADAYAIPWQTETNRDQTTSIRNNNQAEISAISMISAPVMALRSSPPPARRSPSPQTARGSSEP